MDRPSLWARFIKHKRKQTRSLKELNESAPVMQEVLELVQNTQLPEGEKFTIIDLCSGFGFMSMFLAEMLPAEKVDRIVLVDKMWPMRNQVLRPTFRTNLLSGCTRGAKSLSQRASSRPIRHGAWCSITRRSMSPGASVDSSPQDDDSARSFTLRRLQLSARPPRAAPLRAHPALRASPRATNLHA